VRLVARRSLQHRSLGARLDHLIIGTNFAGANLSRASLFRPAAFSGLEIKREEAPQFTGADLSGARVFSRFGNGDWRGVNLAAAQLGVDRATQDLLMRTELAGSDLAGANLVDADLAGRFWHLPTTGADLSRQSHELRSVARRSHGRQSDGRESHDSRSRWHGADERDRPA
jgi:uncharacterized protein YjbI with pentapeptide repeats